LEDTVRLVPRGAGERREAEVFMVKGGEGKVGIGDNLEKSKIVRRGTGARRMKGVTSEDEKPSGAGRLDVTTEGGEKPGEKRHSRNPR
jgi:hypothetical protein